MRLSLGVDTGGTYTDAVLLRDDAGIIASAKSLTTRHDLSVGISDAVAQVLQSAEVAAADITLAALSTTLATNALVEGHGGRIGFIAIGFNPNDLERAGLSDAMRGDPVLHLAGGHNHAGTEAQVLDLPELDTWLADLGPVSGFAVAGQFSTRNPAHEKAVAERCRAFAPVSCSHQLSARLGGPKRAMTAVLNARLIGLTHRLIGRAEDGLRELGIQAPLMVVRGDGALMSAAQATERPIETILSGPAASVVGARWLTGVDTALVSDIGGTTTDVALLRGGRPKIDPDGARVGPYRTMVEAVAMRTHGLGGDSVVAARESGLEGGITLGPGRLVPISLIAQDAPEIAHKVLDTQLRNALPGELDGRFLRPVPGIARAGLDARDAALLDRITGVVSAQSVLRNRIDHAALRRLVARGLVQMAGVTPSDAAHVLGLVNTWDTTAAHKALKLLARRRTGSGARLAETPEALAREIIKTLQDRTAQILLESALVDDGFDGTPEDLAQHEVMQKGLAGHSGLVRLQASLNVPVVGLGASAGKYYPDVGTRLGCQMILPEHGPVANAIGAVVGRIVVRRQGNVTSPSEGRFRAHLSSGPEDFPTADAALSRMKRVLLDEAETLARDAGAQALHHHVDIIRKEATLEARDIFVEAEINVEVSGRPRVAAEN